MKSKLLLLAAAGLLIAGPASAAGRADAETQAYTARANARAAALLSAAGLDSPAAPVSVRAKVDADGFLTRLEVLRTSGSAQTDSAVARVLRRILISDAPVGLLNATVTLNVGRGGGDRLSGQ
ncbi:MAG: hypothetical protein ACXWKR_17830 [Phenylobacterium sp.]